MIPPVSSHRTTNNILLNNDLLKIIFHLANPNARDLVLWSIVSKQFYQCSNDIDLWKTCAKKHFTSDESTVERIKQSVFRIMRNNFLNRNGAHQLMIQQTPLVTTTLSNHRQFPIKHNEKQYSIYQPPYYCSESWWKKNWVLELKENGNWHQHRLAIPLDGVIDQRVWAHENLLIYTETQNTSTWIKMIDINKIKYHSDVPIAVFGGWYVCTPQTIKYNHVSPYLIHRGNIISDINVKFSSESICVEIISKCDGENKKLTFNNHYNHINCLIKAIQTLKQSHLGSEQDKKSFLSEFSQWPSSLKHSIYAYLLQVQGSEDNYKNTGEDAFYNRNKQASTVTEKIEALQRCLRELQLKTIEIDKNFLT